MAGKVGGPLRPYYEDDNCQIWHGDFVELAAAGALGPVDAAITSPPYNVGVDYGDDGWEDSQMPDTHANQIGLWCCALRSTMTGNARAWINVAPVVAMTDGQRLPLAYHWTQRLIAAGFSIRDQVTWSSARGHGTAWGSYESPSAPNLRGDHEVIILAHTGDWKRCAPESLHDWRDGDGGWPGLVTNVWSFPPEHATATDHPVPFPLELPSRCIRLSTWPGETVLDPFMGSGTTLRAAVNLGRKAVGCDLSERFCEIAATRMSQGSLF